MLGTSIRILHDVLVVVTLVAVKVTFKLAPLSPIEEEFIANWRWHALGTVIKDFRNGWVN